MYLSQKQIIKYLILVIILVLVNGLLIIPYFKNIKEIYTTLTKEARALEQKYISGQGIEKSNQDFLTFKDKMPNFDTLFIKQGAELSLITKLEQLAENYNLSQELGLGLEKKQLPSQINRIPFNFTLKGDFINFLNYLIDLNDMNYNLSIQDINIKQLSNRELEFRLLGYTYWFIPTSN